MARQYFRKCRSKFTLCPSKPEIYGNMKESRVINYNTFLPEFSNFVLFRQIMWKKIIRGFSQSFLYSDHGKLRPLLPTFKIFGTIWVIFKNPQNNFLQKYRSKWTFFLMEINILLLKYLSKILLFYKSDILY